MKKRFIYTFASTLLTASVAISGFTACSNDDVTTEQQPTPNKGLKTTLSFSFDDAGSTRAISFGSDGVSSTSTFDANDKVYVYNVTTGKFDPSYLTIKNITDGGIYATFTGTLTGTYSQNDQIKYFYNLTDFNYANTYNCLFDYISQAGTAASAAMRDYAISADGIVVNNITENTMTTYGPNLLKKQQSMYRQHLTFEDKDGNSISRPTSITGIQVTTRNNQLVQNFRPFDTDNVGNIGLNSSAVDSNDDLYMALRINSSDNDALIITITADDGTVYEGVKNAPAGGFKNGKYYHGTMTMKWKYGLVKPTITNNVAGTSTPSPNSYNCYQFMNDNDNIDVTLSGLCYGYNIYVNGSSGTDAIFRLNGLQALLPKADEFIYSYRKLVFELIGENNSISCPNYGQVITPSGGGHVRFMGNGSLTLTCRSPQYSWSTFNPIYPNDDVAAADGYVLTISAPVDNGDGTTSATYTVRPE